MTNEEAINLLDNLIGMVEDNQNSDYDTALKMAIETLKQPERKKGKWISILGGTFFKCAVCDYDEVYDKKYNFCPNCGCEMER